MVCSAFLWRNLLTSPTPFDCKRAPYLSLNFNHSGSFQEGMNYGPLGLYDGIQLAARYGVCLVGTNYRLGVLGSLVVKGSRGNQGIKDQRAAMKWCVVPTDN